MPCLVFARNDSNVSQPGGRPKWLGPRNVMTQLARKIISEGDDMVMGQSVQLVSDRTSDLHTHDGWTYFVVLEGSGHLRANSGFKGQFDNQRLDLWSIGSIPPDELHRFEADKGTLMLVCIFYTGRTLDEQQIIRRSRRKPPEGQ